MKNFLFKISLFFVFLVCVQCRKKEQIANQNKTVQKNDIQFAHGFSLHKFRGFSILKVVNPWPKSTKSYTYILKQKNGIVPDSLSQNMIIDVPIKTIIVTSTTHIPSLEMLGVGNSLVGFPNLSYISSEKIRARIDAGKIAELGNNQSLNIEKTIELAPSVFVGYGIDNNNPTLDNLEKSGQKILLNGDWNEETPLGKAEWIKFFGALFRLDSKAKIIFDKIANDYSNTKIIAAKASLRPTVLAGAMYQDVWYMPKGKSWGSLILADANAQYLWAETTGTGSLNLNFETVLERGQKANFWIQGQFTTFDEMKKANKHYSQFESFQNQNVYTFGSKKGKTGGLLYYELAPNRPDLVLKDIVKILHPELLSGYKPYFLEKLK